MEDILSQIDLTNIFKVTRGTIYLWVKTKSDFPKPFKAGRRLLWKRSEIESYLESSRQEGRR
ncbi:MAG: helix-turn-helix domain-containing protein [Holosporaceae bacterium]|jgi:predicted DNA-binding transcriptional regulator AlpA|nr:helix-turn-helix domain-containing protein [Holosporaceae bacterium]